MRPLRVLVACEESQEVTKAFRALGHEAYSCDLQACSGGHPEWHIMHDALEVAYLGIWDLMIGHPPCTYFSKAGMHYLKTRPERPKQLEKAFEFWKKMYNAPIDRIALENPVGWLNTNWKKPNQIIQPYYFGDPEIKTTCLWLKGLSRLNGNLDAVKPEPKGYVILKSKNKEGRKYNYYFHAGKSAKARSKTFPGIAKAMALQWSRHILNHL